MLKMISTKYEFENLQKGETMKYLSVPEDDYDKLKGDFKHAKHFEDIEQLCLYSSEGVLIKSNNEKDALLAAIYIIKKYEQEKLKENKDDLFEPIQDYKEEACDHLIYQNNKLVRLPIVDSNSFSLAYDAPQYEANGFDNNRFVFGKAPVTEKPYWFNGTYPLILTECIFSSFPIESLEVTNRFIIYISIKKDIFFDDDFLDSNYYDQKLLFDLDYEICQVNDPDNLYYEKILVESAKLKKYKISKTLNKEKLIIDLKDYRKSEFQGTYDVDKMVTKAIKKKKDLSKTLNKSDFDKVFTSKKTHKKSLENNSEKNSHDELNELIGLEDVKQQLNNVIKRMKFDSLRKAEGYKTKDSHMAAVFMGNPGTAKTTVARIFSRMLCEEGVLGYGQFIEVSRKDLVGMYVGWTAPTVARIFEQAKGGVIFIDEAYSLISDIKSNGFSDEALSEIIRQMENNPDTLVIFAGYTNEMRNFVKSANPGLRSRLTNIVEFKDYSNKEMIDIFMYLLAKENFKINKQDEIIKMIDEFVETIKGLGSENIGNGRLMRKLFKTSVGYMATREDNDLVTISLSDIENAIIEIENGEKLISLKDKREKIGFL